MAPLIVTAALIIDDGRVLVTRRRADSAHPHLWEFPGGKLEPAEDPRDGIAREIREELGMTVHAGAVYEVLFHSYPERDVLVIVYRCCWLSGTPRDLEVAEHRWATPDEMLRLDFLPADVPLVKRLSLELSHEDPSLLHDAR